MKTNLARLGSTRAAVVLLLFLVVTIVACRLREAWGYGLVAVPLGLLAVSLCIALVTHARLRARPALFVFHVALVCCCVSAGASAVFRFEGRLEIAEDQAFDSRDVVVTQAFRGARPEALDEVRFLQGPLQVEFGPGLARRRSTSVLRGAEEELSATDTQAARVGGFRFSMTSNKGVALVLTWRSARDAAITGAVHLPSFPVRDWKQIAEWQSPAGEMLRFELDGLRVPMDRPWQFSRAFAQRPVRLHRAEAAIVLPEGQWVAVSGGEIRLEAVRLWIGYRVSRDPAAPWLFWSAVAGLLSLGWHVASARVTGNREPGVALPGGTRRRALVRI